MDLAAALRFAMLCFMAGKWVPSQLWKNDPFECADIYLIEYGDKQFRAFFEPIRPFCRYKKAFAKNLANCLRLNRFNGSTLLR